MHICECMCEQGFIIIENNVYTYIFKIIDGKNK